MTKGSHVTSATRKKMAKAQRARFRAGKPHQKSRRKTRVSWKRRATEAEQSLAELAKSAEDAARDATAFSSLRESLRVALLPIIRETIRDEMADLDFDVVPSW